ncbi:hypothetical protein ACFP65_01490 [Marinilactibacillus sp. GCM10026970]|uniref:hypothetical protein n=1 Tax=Marinilactibacillus sp. GCM10026970 TaxID=3252642 RepID=UPI00361EF5B7
MKFKVIGLLITSISLFACSEVEDALESEDKAEFQMATGKEVGNTNLLLITSEIHKEDSQLEVLAEEVDESKTSYFYVANEKVFEEKIQNGKSYKLDIEGIEGAHTVDYNPKLQFIQYTDDTEDGEISAFKQFRYNVIE